MNPKQAAEFVNASDSGNKTALHYACMVGYESIIKYLLNKIKVVMDKKDDKNKTPLDYAKENDHQNIVLLLENDKT